MNLQFTEIKIFSRNLLSYSINSSLRHFIHLLKVKNTLQKSSVLSTKYKSVMDSNMRLLQSIFDELYEIEYLENIPGTKTKFRERVL